MIQNAERADQSLRTVAAASPANALLCDPRHRLALARRFGSSTIAYSAACQPGLQYFGNECGFISYNTKWGYRFALGDPLVAPTHLAKLVHGFISKGRIKPCFVHVSKSTAEVLAECGFFINQMGVDTWLELDRYDFSGKAKAHLRYASNWLTRRNYHVEESTFERISKDSVAELSREWRRTRPVKNREVTFLNRPLVLEDEPDVRKFFLLDEQRQLQAFVFFDPIYQDNNIIGYSTVIKRRRPSATPYAEQGLMRAAIEIFKREGVHTVRLGLSPLSNMTDRTFPKRNPLLHLNWRYGFQATWVNRYLYNLRGHAQFKRRFRGTEHPVYFATPALINEPRLLALLRLVGVFGRPR